MYCIYSICWTKRETDKCGRGTIGVITSNNGHLERADGILQAYGFDNFQVVLLSEETILRRYNYDRKYLNGLEAIHQKEETIRGHLRWAEGVKRLPEYVLSEIATLHNDKRLRSVVAALDRWYQKVNVNIFERHPELADCAEMDANTLREKLRGIKRELPPESWGQKVDVLAAIRNIRRYDEDTARWIDDTRSAKQRAAIIESGQARQYS